MSLETDTVKKLKLKLKLNNIKLSSLLDITKAINNNFSTAQLLEIYENVLRKELNIGKMALFVNYNGWSCLLKYGFDDQLLQVNVERDLLKVTEITNASYLQNSLLDPIDVVIPVFHKTSPLAYILIGDIDEKKIEVSPTIKHLPFIQTYTNIIVVAIENKKLTRENLRQAKAKKEMELASEMQSMLIPRKLPNNERLEVAGYYQPNQEIGGDYYDFIRLNENEFVFCVADVSGKGVSAALLMSNFQANLRALFNQKLSLTEIIKELNTKVIDNTNGEKFITLFVAKYNLVTRVLNYVNAGHNPPLLMNKKTVSLLKTGCIGLGMLDEIPVIKEGIICVSENTTIFCYTDGLVEVENDEGQEFGTESLLQVLLENSSANMNDLNRNVISKLAVFKQSKTYFDDIALLSCNVR